MAKKIPRGLDYLNNRPYRIWWRVIAPKGAKLSILQENDLIYDDYDLRIRKIEIYEKKKTFDEGTEKEKSRTQV